MTEVLADIERHDQPVPHQGHQSLPPGVYGQPRSETPSPPKNPIERVRAMDRASPDNQDLQSRRQRELARESPKTRERQPTSPSNAAFIQQNQQAGAPTPERRQSPKPPIPPPNDQPVQQPGNLYGRDLYAARDTAVAPRRPVNIGSDPRSNGPYNSQTPPLQSITARTPDRDRSLPVQEHEDVEDEFHPKGHWKDSEHNPLDQHRLPSPTPSSDLNPDGNAQRFDRPIQGGQPTDNRNGRRGDDGGPQAPTISTSESSNRYSDQEDDSGHGSYTPRSPTANLPDTSRVPEKFYQPQAHRLSPKHPSRVKSRNGSIDGLGLRTIDPSVFDPNSQPLVTPTTSNPERSPRVDHRPPHNVQYQDAQHRYHPQVQQQQQQQQSQHHQYGQPNGQQPHQPTQPSRLNQQEPPSPADYHNAYYGQPHVYPDDFQNYSEDPASLAYLHAYLASPRPDAPIPPTPHSASAAPSPSPFPNIYGGKGMPAYVPVVPVGSPYPYPFTHVRRNPLLGAQSAAGAGGAGAGAGGALSQSSSYDPNHPAAIQEQLAKQWQIYLQNQVNGNMTDSSFSPAATPFQGANYNPFTFLHTARLTRQAQDTMSIRSSPSHEPVPLPAAPTLQRKKDTTRATVQQQRTQSTRRKQPAPPRVASTQPRDTSPEPESSGEETAGEYSHAHTESHSTSQTLAPARNDDDGSSSPAGTWNIEVTNADVASKDVDSDDAEEDWIDEDDEADDNDFLDFEYHPNYVPNSDKRRRRWEVGWEGLVQAVRPIFAYTTPPLPIVSAQFQNLDRQTDTTMVVLASPPHSTKLYSIRSRSIRRTAVLRNSTALREIRSGFKRLAAQRKNLRPAKHQSLEKLLENQSISGDGSDGSNESRAEDLRKALGVALDSLNMLNGMYEMRETRWQEEMRRMQADKEKMSLILNQVLGGLAPHSPSVKGGAAGKLV